MRRSGHVVVLVAAAALAQDDLLRQAARLDAEGKCAEAERYYQQALAGGPASTALLNNLGNHYLACGQPGRARSYFEQVLRRKPNHQNANLQLARLAAEGKQGAQAIRYLAQVTDSGPAVRLLQAEALHWAGRHSEAERVLAAVETEAGGDPRVLFTLGKVCARVGLYDRAAAAFQTVLTERPGDPDVLFELGRTCAIRRDFVRAVFYLAQARQQAPRRADVLLALARAAEEAGFYGDSALAYDEYLQLHPRDDTARRDRARVYGYTGTRLEEGLKELTWYVAKHPKDPLGHYHLAQLTWRSEPEKSLQQLATALRLDPKLAPAHVSRAWLLQRLGRAQEALPHLEAALRLDAKDVRALDQLGLAYLALERPSEAEKVLRRALGIAPEDPEVLLHLGRALASLDRQEEAERYLEQYQRVRPRYREPRKEPGMIELAALPEPERRKREIERFRVMAASRPDDPKLQLHLAELLLADGKVEEALKEFRELLTLNADRQIWETAGQALVRAGQHGLAQEFLKRARQQ